MADKSNWYDFLIPSDDKRKIIEDGLEEGILYSRIVGEEGVDGLIKRLREEELLNEGLSEDEVRKRITEEKNILNFHHCFQKTCLYLEKQKLLKQRQKKI